MKKIVIFTCIGGHTTISQALFASLHSSYDVAVANIFTDVLQKIDIIAYLTNQKYSFEKLYSIVLQKKWHRFMNTALLAAGYFYFRIRKNAINRLIAQYCNTQKPALIISVIPLFNDIFLSFAKNADIPFIVMPTDIDFSMFLHNIVNPAYKKFVVALAIDNQLSRRAIISAKIPETSIVVTGVALKTPFFEQYDDTKRNDIRQQFGIPADIPVILLLMGSQGSISLYDFAQALSTITTISFHLIIVGGHNSTQIEQISAHTFPANISITIFGFTTHIPALLAISNLIITKSGGISIYEALYMHVPMLLDASSCILRWEKLNQQFVIDHTYGCLITNIDQVAPYVTQFLQDPHIRTRYQRALDAFITLNGTETVKRLVKRYIG